MAHKFFKNAPAEISGAKILEAKKVSGKMRVRIEHRGRRRWIELTVEEYAHYRPELETAVRR